MLQTPGRGGPAARLLVLRRVVRHRATWWGLIGIVALLVALVSAAATGADTVPSGPGGSASLNVDPGGQQRGASTDIVSADGTSGVHVQWNAACPDTSPPGTAPGNYWSVQASVKREDGTTAVYDSAAYGPGPPTSAPPGQNSFDLQVNMRRDPSGKPVPRETFTWTVTLICHNQATTIGSGTFTLCSGATAASTDAKDFIKSIERGECHKVTRKNGTTKTVCDAVALKEYNDSAGHCTIGWGHKLHDGKCECTDPAAACTNKAEDAHPSGGTEPIYKGITEQEASKLLDQDVSTAESLVTPRLSKPVNQCQFDGLTDFFFNIGRQALYRNAAKKDFAPSHIAMDLRDGDYAKVPADMLRYDKNNPELHRRRQMDADTFATQDCNGC